MEKYWYFAAFVLFSDNNGLLYSGYVTSKDYFPIGEAELQALDNAKASQGEDGKAKYVQTTIINQVEVSKYAYESWKVLKKV